MLTLDSILNGLTEAQMDLVVGSRVQAGGKSCGYSKSHSKSTKSKRTCSTHKSRSSCYDPCNPCYR